MKSTSVPLEQYQPAAESGGDTAGYISVFDLFKVGIGPSSSHSVGPMQAAAVFIKSLADRGVLAEVIRIQIDLYGSLALTGKGHGTDTAIMMGLMGEWPDQIDPDVIPGHLARIRQSQSLELGGTHTVEFDESKDFVFHKTECLPGHPNGMSFSAYHESGLLKEAVYYSIGGGFIIEDGVKADGKSHADVPYPFSSAEELLEICEREAIDFSEIARRNELALYTEAALAQGLDKIWQAMQGCVKRGLRTEGILPGGLKLNRRAPALFRKLNQNLEFELQDPLQVLDWVDLFALAVNEENAAGGRVVTAPTNGAAGIIPAVLHYYHHFCPEGKGDTEGKRIHAFLLTAAVIGSLYKKNASISGAEVGCQGEVGVACSMAAGALTQVLGGSPRQVEEAAEIGMEHNLGLTCDPIKGLVQVPCIERNAMGAVKAINASRLALSGDGKHLVSLDRVIRVMKRTGADMSSRYKETSRGGLAVNLSEC